MCYDRTAPGINFTTDYMTKDEITALSSPVTVYHKLKGGEDSGPN